MTSDLELKAIARSLNEGLIDSTEAVTLINKSNDVFTMNDSIDQIWN